MRVLICNHALRNHAGSEIHCCELAEHLIANGHSVTAASFYIGEPIAGELERIGAEIVPLDSGRLAPEWDLIWRHHVTCFAEVHARQRLKARRHVHGLLSSVLPLERVPLLAAVAIDKSHFTLLANAPLTANVAKPLVANGVRINLLWNLAPAVWQVADGRRRERLEKIAVVSTHPPPELLELEHVAGRRGVQLQFFGNRGDNTVRITPDVRAPFHAVITIGKTVQYCLAAGIPVFVYDHFGGPGWLNRLNIEAAEHNNYAGKFTPRSRPTEMLWKELTAGFEEAIKFHLSRRKCAAGRYDIGGQLHRLRLLKVAREPLSLIKDHDDAAAHSIIAFSESTLSPSNPKNVLTKILRATRFH